MNLPPLAGAARDAAILQAIRDGRASTTWANVSSSANGHTATFSVLADALKIDGVRVSASATLLQQICDLYGALLLTPRLSDLCFLQAQTVIPPAIIWPPATDTAGMVRESEKIDAELVAVGNPPYGLIAPIGKPWVLANMILAHPGRACLYGWASKKPIQGVPLYAGTLPGVQVIQPISTAHDTSYSDYAMLANFVSRACTVDGQPRDLADVLTSPDLAPLASHEGPLKLLRQPGVPLLEPLSPIAGGGAEAASLVSGGGGGGGGGMTGGQLVALMLVGGLAGFLGGLAALGRA